MLRLAFLGCGWATRIHSRVLAGRTDVARAYASRDAARAGAYAERYGGRALAEGYGQALADTSVDAVVIATPPATHLALTLRALRAGKHVIVEKPAFARAVDVDTARRTATLANRVLLVAENYHYKPLRERLRRLLAGGAVGRPLFLEVNAVRRQVVNGWRAAPGPCGTGALHEGGIHWIHLLAGLGLTVESAHGFSPNARQVPERSMLVVLRYAEGPVATLHYSWDVASPLKGLRLSHVWGTRGAITFETNGLFVATRGHRWSLALPGLGDVAGYRGMWDDFIATLRDGRSPSMTLELAERDLKLVEAIYAGLD